MEEETDNVHSIQPDPVSENMDAASSSSSSCTAPTLWHWNCSGTVRNGRRKQWYELLQIIKSMQKFSLFSKYGTIVQSYANHVAPIVDQHFAEKNRQTANRYYFHCS